MTGDFVAVEHISQHFRELQAGDVIVCISPAAPGRAVLKRILGMVNTLGNIFVSRRLTESLAWRQHLR